jgi:dihydroorotase
MSAQATLLKGARVIDPDAGIDRVTDVLVSPDAITLDPAQLPPHVEERDARGLWAVPGLIDLQVHFREPGFDYKEDLHSGSDAALAGGVTTVVVMPNTRPALHSPEAVRFQMEESRKVGRARILVAAAATYDIAGERLTDHGALKAAGAVAITDDGLPVLDDALMEGSLAQCAEHDLLFMQHAEDTRMTHHAPMNLGPTSKKLGVEGQSADAEGVIVERDIDLVRKLGGVPRYHVLHTSTARSLQAVRKAKDEGLHVSCEASPHHLLLTDEACSAGDPNFKMNPPLKSEADRAALEAAVIDGTVDAVATDHAPHAASEKAKGFVDAPFGVIGLETAFAAVLDLMHRGLIDTRRAVELMTAGPARVLKATGELGTLVGARAALDLTLIDPERSWTVSEKTLRGRSKNSSFLGRTFKGQVLATFKDGRLIYEL